MADQFAYEDFDLLIERGARGRYRARVVRSPAGESAEVQFTVPFSALELENFVLKVGLARRTTRGPGRPESAPLKDFGGKLYGAVFRDELRDVLLRSLSQTRAQQQGMRLRLKLADTPELAELPWEFLYDPRLNRFLAQSRHTPLVRYLDLPDPPRPLSVEGPLRLLVMISNPAGYPELDVEQEWSLLIGALAQQQEEGRVIVERLAASMKELRQRLRREEFHVFHFVGHGRYRPDWGDGVLVMEDRHGQPHEVTGEELGGLLSEYHQTRLAVLNACEGARSGASDPFAGMAQSLIQQGLPAVVAMQFEITDDAAIIFAQELYGAIADGYPLEAALAEARGAIRDEGNLTEWGTPVLYSRAPDGRLFDLTRSARPEAERQAKAEADRRAREEAELQAKAEADRQAREEADRQAKAEAELQAKAEADRQAREEADRKAKAAADRKAKAAADRQAKAAADSKAREEARAAAERAESHRQSGHLDEALSDFNRAIELDPGNAWAFNQRGVVHAAMGHAAEEFADFDHAAVLNPTDAMTLANRGNSYRKLGRPDKALADLNRAIELDPGNAWAFECRALSFQELGCRDEALADFKCAFGLDPDLARSDTGTSSLKSKARKSAAALRDERRTELVEALKRQGYTSRAPYSVYKAKRNPDFRIKFTTTGVRFEVKNQQGRWDLAMTMLLTRHYLEALALIEGPPRTLLQAICATRAVISRDMKWLQQRNADLRPEGADRRTRAEADR